MTNHTAGGITTWVGTGTPEFLERFVELIVQECIVISQVGSITEEKIKRHFGVNCA